MTLSTRAILLLVFALSLASLFPKPSAAQEPKPGAPPPDSPSATQANEKAIEKDEQSRRILGVVPQFGVTDRQDAPPLTTGGKLHLFAKAAFDPVEFGLVGLQAAVSQGENEFPEYGQGFEGYGKRYGASFADEVSSGFFSNFLYPVLLKEDPRYFRLGVGSIKHRIAYSMSQEFVCHTDKGGRTFNFSNVLGAVSSGGLSNVYYPESDRGFGLTMSRSAIALLYGSLGGLSDEFWPDISQRLFHKRHKSDINPQSAQSGR
jgi:hypothetical protein